MKFPKTFRMPKAMMLPARRRSLSTASASSEHSRWPPSARLSTSFLRPNDSHSYSATSSALSLRVTIQLHYDLRRTRSVFGTFVAYPKMRWRKSEPEKGLRVKTADDIQNAKVRDHLEFVAVELARGSFHVFFPSIFEGDAVHAWLIAQNMYRKRCDPIEWKKPKNSGDALDG